MTRVEFARSSHLIWTTALRSKVVSGLKNMASELSPKLPTKQELVILVSHEVSSYVPSTNTYPGSGTNHTSPGAAIYGRLKDFPSSAQEGRTCQFKAVLMKYYINNLVEMPAMARSTLLTGVPMI